MITAGAANKAEGQEVDVRINHEQNYKDKHKKLASQLTQVSTELSILELLKVSLNRKKHKMSRVVLDKVQV